MESKVYIVTDEFGTELKTFKTMAAAKKLADAQHGKVMCDGQYVYTSIPATAPAELEITAIAEEPEKAATPVFVGDDDHTKAGIDGPITVQDTAGVAEPVVAEEQKVEQPEDQSADEPETYRLTALMNIRSAPSLNAAITGLGKPGELVKVDFIEKDWMKTDKGYILYGKGQFAVKV